MIRGQGYNQVTKSLVFQNASNNGRCRTNVSVMKMGKDIEYSAKDFIELDVL